jgi:hypothetical protein
MGRWAVLPYHERRDGNALQDSARYDLPALMGADSVAQRMTRRQLEFTETCRMTTLPPSISVPKTSCPIPQPPSTSDGIVRLVGQYGADLAGARTQCLACARLRCPIGPV